MTFEFKQIAARILITLIMLLAPACASVDTQPRAVIVAWHTLDGARERTLLNLIDRWNQTNADSALIVPERRDPSAQHEAMLNGASSEALPGLALVAPAQAAAYDQHSMLAQLDAFVNSDDPALTWDAGDRTDLYPFIQQAGRTVQGRLIGVPLGGDVRVLLSNPDWAAALGQADLPTTWDAFSKLCNGATDNFAGTLCFGFDPTDASLEEWMQAHGTSIYNRDAQQFQIASPDAANAIEQLFGYLQSGQAYRAQSPERSRDDFAAARVLFAFAWSSQLSEFVDIVRGRNNFNLHAGTLPFDSNRPSALLRAPLWVIPKSTRERERAAWEFINWLLAEEQTAQWAAQTGELPARASAINQLNLNLSQPADALRSAILQRIAPNAQPAPLLSGWPCVQEEMENGLRQIFDGQPIPDTLLLLQSRAQNEVNTDCSAP